MARIRTVKPEFFLHEGLFDLEQETGLPMRIAYQGLWCQADKEGRFPWQPRKLKTQICPYDDIDFSRVLDALATRGFLIKYACGTDNESTVLGAIPSFKVHQFINNKEPESTLPAFDANGCTVITCTREAREADASGTRSYKERKGKEGNGKGRNTPKAPKGANVYSPAFDSFWEAYPRKAGKERAYKAWKKAGKQIKERQAVETNTAIEIMLVAAREFSESPVGRGDYCPHPSSWLNGGHYNDDRAEWHRVKETKQDKPAEFRFGDDE